MTEYQHIYNKKRAYRKAQNENVRTSKNYKRLLHKSDLSSDRTTTPLDPRRLTSAERRTLLQQRIMELEDNQRIINNIQNEIVRDKQKSRYSDHAKRMQTSEYDLYVGPYKNPPIKESFRSSYDSFDLNDKFKPDYSQFRYRGGEGTKHVQNVRKAGRSRRKSILEKAEELINARKRREYPSDYDTYRSRKGKHKVYVSERLSSASSGEEYKFVPEDIDSDSSSNKDTSRQPRVSRVQSWKSGVPSVVQSEIPVLDYDSDVDVEEHMYDGTRPLTDTAREFNNYRRFEGEFDRVQPNFRNPAHQKCSNGCLVKFFYNGHSQHKGHIISINDKIKSFSTLLEDLTKKFRMRVDNVYSWPHGKEITSLSQFHNRCVYVVAPKSQRKNGNVLIPVSYGASRENYWSNRKMSGGRRKHENELYKKDKDFKESPVRNMPMVITVSYKSAPDIKEKFILNPQTTQEFEAWLEDLSKPNLPVRALYLDKPPYSQMKSFTHIFREHQMNNGFLACAEEMKPSELKKRQAPSSNSSTDSTGDSKNRKPKLQKQQDMGQIFENGSPDSSISTAMSRFENGQQHQSRVRGRRKDSRLKDIVGDKYVELEVDGILKEFYPPTIKSSKDDGGRPHGILKCEWVYGYRGRDTRHNLQVLPDTGELVYCVGAIVVLYDKESDTQRHYMKHTEEISCVAIHPDGITIATGQIHGKKPENWAHIQIWDGETLNTNYMVGLGVLNGNVISIDFSKDAASKYICALDSSSKHLLSVWDWKNDREIARTTTTLEAVHCACFYPDGANNSILITYGVRHIYFWKIFFDAARKSDAKIYRDRQSGIFELSEGDIPNSINCIAFPKSGDVVTGDSSGNVMVWCREAKDVFICKKEIRVCKDPITAVVYMEEDNEKLLMASSYEIRALDVKNGYTLIDKKKETPQGAGEILALVPQRPKGAGGIVYAGTTNDAIFEGSIKHKFRCIVQSHYGGYCCLAPHQIEPSLFSAGHDQVIYKWSMINHKVIWGRQIEHKCTALAALSRSMKTFDIVAVGTDIGVIFILHAYNGMNITTVQVGVDPIGCLSFSDDKSRIAVGCNDGSISVYEIPDRKTFIKDKVSTMCHSDGVASLDWSKDGRCIQSSSYSNELMFWNTDTMDPVESPTSVRNIDWYTMNCPIAYGYIGPWSNMGKREVIKVANRSPNNKYCVTGDSCGRIRLYKYPCTKENAEFRGIRVYSGDVTAVVFTADDDSLVTCGGADAGMIQWEIVED